MKIPKSIRQFVDIFSRLPGIGPRQAIRLAFYFLRQGLAFQEEFLFSKIAGLFAFVIFTDICGDLAWYYMGKKLRGTPFGEKIHSKIPKAKDVAQNLEKHSSKLVFFSKYIPSSTFAIIFSSLGVMRGVWEKITSLVLMKFRRDAFITSLSVSPSSFAAF